MWYLAYDVRGIQSFVFAVPRLKYIVGGSALVDRFDHETAPDLAAEAGCELIHSGGGKGVFAVADDSAGDLLQERLVEEGRRIGLDLRIGRDADFSEATHCADRLFPYVPHDDELEGDPCEESGLYPRGASPAIHGDRQVAGVVKRRLHDAGDAPFRRYEDRLLAGLEPHPALPPIERLRFFRDVDPATEEGHAGASAIGDRNRWAVVAMDGNGMGRQFRDPSVRALVEADPAAHRRWLRDVGRTVAETTETACRRGIEEVVRQWAGDGCADDQRCRTPDGALVLPVRPLIVGGDDVVLLCHPGYAAQLVTTIAETFESHSARSAERARGEHPIGLWPASGGRLTISAGLLFAPVGLPLSTAVPYAETLLGLAKEHGRRLERDGAPAPACVEWESVTEGLLDHPLRRRQRGLVFLDADDGGRRVELTRRPYTLEAFGQLRKQADELFAQTPASVVHGLRRELRAGRSERRVLYARLGKRRGDLARLLGDEDGACADLLGWSVEADGARRLGLLDALDLATERRRLEWETVR